MRFRATPTFWLETSRAPARGARHANLSSLLPAVPASAARPAHEEADRPQDQPDDENPPENVHSRREKSATAEDQQQQDQDDKCSNHSVVHLLSRIGDSRLFK